MKPQKKLLKWVVCIKSYIKHKLNFQCTSNRKGMNLTKILRYHLVNLIKLYWLNQFYWIKLLNQIDQKIHRTNTVKTRRPSFVNTIYRQRRFTKLSRSKYTTVCIFDEINYYNHTGGKYAKSVSLHLFLENKL